MKYDININPVIIELLPPDKRKSNTLQLVNALFSPLQWARNLLFDTYYNGLTVLNYEVREYSYLEQAVYQKKVYSSLIDGNNNLPTDSVTWLMIQDNFIGVKERLLYNGSRLVLEYALNKQFGSVFRQPDNISDIYITNNDPILDGFIVGETDDYCSSVGQTTSSDAIGGDLPYIYINNFTINIPTAVLDLTETGNTESVRNFVNKYIPASIKYEIINI